MVNLSNKEQYLSVIMCNWRLEIYNVRLIICNLHLARSNICLIIYNLLLKRYNKDLLGN